MPKSTDSINQDLEDLLASKGYEATPLDSSGKEVPVSSAADLLQFHFHRDGKDYGTVTATIDGLQKLTIYYDDEIADSGGINEENGDRGAGDTSWFGLLKQLKKFAHQHQLGFVLKDTDRLRNDMKRRVHAKKLEESKAKEMNKKQKVAESSRLPKGVAANSQTKLDEGYYGNRKMSYSDDTPTVKMVIKHNRQLEETDQRFRHIEKIFLETSDGERFQVPTNKPSRARMFARHIAEGGAYRDDRWSHLNEICEDLDKLGGFVRATHNKREQFNESAQRMINEAQEQYQQLRETVKKLSGTKGYNKYFESYEPRVILEDDTDLAEAFMHSSIDTRIESALPTLSKFGIKMGKINESDMFSEWADSLVNETLDPDSPRQVEALVELLSAEIPVGPNAEVAIGELTDVIEDDELYNRLRRAAKANPDSDARPQIISWMQEQDNENYRQALEKIEADTGDSEKDQEELKKGNQSDAEEPAKVKPRKKRPQPGVQPAGGLPPLPGDNAGGLPPLPPLPPLKEGDDALASFKRLLGK
jgi:hypothetical protein